MGNVKTEKTEFQIRQALPEDAALVVAYMQKLGTYQKMRESITATDEKMKALLKEGRGEAIFGEYNGNTVGFMYYYENSSAFIGEHGIYIDGFYIDEEYRSKGFGRLMMQFIAQQTIKRGGRRLEWGCLDWNTTALDFYKTLGAKGVDIMTIYRLTPDKIRDLAES